MLPSSAQIQEQNALELNTPSSPPSSGNEEDRHVELLVI